MVRDRYAGTLLEFLLSFTSGRIAMAVSRCLGVPLNHLPRDPSAPCPAANLRGQCTNTEDREPRYDMLWRFLAPSAFPGSPSLPSIRASELGAGALARHPAMRQPCDSHATAMPQPCRYIAAVAWRKYPVTTTTRAMQPLSARSMVLASQPKQVSVHRVKFDLVFIHSPHFSFSPSMDIWQRVWYVPTSLGRS
jgi:hypothetical protein